MIVKYVAFYGRGVLSSTKNASPAAMAKIDYVAQCMIGLGCDVEVISPIWNVRTPDGGAKISKNEEPALDSSFKICYLLGNWIFLNRLKFINVILANLLLIWKIILNSKRCDRLLIYHSLAIVPAVTILRLFTKLPIILEVEEVYTDVGRWREYAKRIERAYIRFVPNSYLLSTEGLEKSVPEDKIRIIVYGPYTVASGSVRNFDRSGDRIKVLYAGIIDQQKRGAFNALAATAYLDERYELRIIGFGDVDELNLEIEHLRRMTECRIGYDGFKSGPEFLDYCSKFDIGLSTQKMDGDYLVSSFPSKILNYLICGLKVVSPRITCVVDSEIGRLVTYYHNDDPMEIAEAIKRVNLNDGLSPCIELNRLHEKFNRELRSMLFAVEH